MAPDLSSDLDGESYDDLSVEINIGLDPLRPTDLEERKYRAARCQEYFASLVSSPRSRLMLVGLLRELDPDGYPAVGVVAGADIPDIGTELWSEQALGVARGIPGAHCSDCRGVTGGAQKSGKAVTSEQKCEECDKVRHKLFCQQTYPAASKKVAHRVDVVLQVVCRIFHRRTEGYEFNEDEMENFNGQCFMFQHMREAAVSPPRESLPMAVFLKNSLSDIAHLPLHDSAYELVSSVLMGLEDTALGSIASHCRRQLVTIVLFNAVRAWSHIVFNEQKKLAFGAASAFLEHSCNPNSLLLLDGNKLVLRTIRPIKAGERVTISRVDELGSTKSRLRDLWTEFGQWCRCPRCKEAMMVSESSGPELCVPTMRAHFCSYWKAYPSIRDIHMPGQKIVEFEAMMNKMLEVTVPQHPVILRMRVLMFQMSMLVLVRAISGNGDGEKANLYISPAECAKLVKDLHLIFPQSLLSLIRPVVLSDLKDIARALAL